MSKFLSLVERFDPQNTGNPTFDLIDFLNEKGIPTRLDRTSNKNNSIFIDIGGEYEVRVEVFGMDNEEEAETFNSDQELNSIASAGVSVSGKAAQVLKKKRALAPKIVSSIENQLKETEKMLNKPKSPIIR